MFSLGKTYISLGDYNKAAKYLEEGFSGYSNGLEAALLPEALIKIGKYDDAIYWCDKILEKHNTRKERTIAEKALDLKKTAQNQIKQNGMMDQIKNKRNNNL